MDKILKKPELLLPAGSKEKMEYAIQYGADALYLGMVDFSLRAMRKGELITLDNLKDCIELAHSYPEEKTLSQITEALEIDVAKLFLPIGESFKKNKENSAKLKSAIANDVRNYVNEILKEFD